ncbi:MAG TPA: NAD(P)-binding domain-containing protein [Ktedonobacteraceae bacterium]|nr:NAD(P)-binding domain-containing protein [Ktedonobacteraceae bacterium]
MNDTDKRPFFDTIIVGAGQAGLAMGYYLSRQDRDFILLDAHVQIGVSWRKRWDSLRLFTPAWISSLPQMPHAGPDEAFLSKDEIADYLERYAAHFHLPVRVNSHVDRLTRENGHYLLMAGDQQLLARNVVVATGSYQQPQVPAFASELDPDICQIHSSEYHNPNQLQDGGVLIVGAGSSGAEIALELASARHVYLAGRDPGHRPKNIPRPLRHLYWWLMHKAINVDNRVGARLREQAERGGAPLIGIAKQAFAQVGVERTPRVTGVQNGRPLLQDGRILDVANVIWCTGFVPDYRWISLPIFDSKGYPLHYRGVVDHEPGLYFLGLPFQYTLTSSFVGGVGRDAEYIAEKIAARSPESSTQNTRIKTALS